MRMVDNDEVGLKNSQKIPIIYKLLYWEQHIQECEGSLLPEGAW